MRIRILTTFPEMIEPIVHSSILGRAMDAGLMDIQAVDIRPYSTLKHKNTDDYPFGGGAGMVMLPQPICDAVDDIAKDFTGRRFYMSPRGVTFNQHIAEQLAKEDDLIILCGHYEGVDQRALDICGFEEMSVGDYV
ncbi:MAG: tRNA (guanosine(37)-N1)-methyltransferase TrmD, partial [Christensenellales bacterium]